MTLQDRWRRRAGVQVRTALIACGTVGLAIALGSGLFVVLLERQVSGGVDVALRQQAQMLVADLEQSSVGGLALRGQLGDSNVVQVLGAGGAVLSASPEIRGEPALTGQHPAPGRSILTTRRLSLDPDAKYRQLVIGARDATGAQVVIVVVQSLESARTSRHAAEALLAVGAPAFLLLVGAMTYWLSGRALGPVEDIRRQVEGIDARNLHARVPLPAAHDEVRRLGGTMNLMLERLDSAAESQRQFVSDASHELRSPLASLRTSVEVALAHPRDADWARTGEVVLAESARVENLVSDLLLLTTADERGLQLRREDVDLDDLVAAETLRLKATGGLQVTSRITAARVRGDRDQLARVLRNLVDNALRHARGHVDVSVSIVGSHAVIDVRDDGPGVPEQERERVFERFVRLEDSRSRAQGGTGLGLAIVRQVVHAHGGTVAFLGDGAGAHVQVRLPRS